MWDAIRSFKVYFKITKELIDDDGERETLLCFQNARVGVPLCQDVVLIRATDELTLRAGPSRLVECGGRRLFP
jgi:hypothetical protein